MKHVAPQPEFGFTAEPMRLIAEASADGDRIQADAERQRQGRADSERAQWWFQQIQQTVATTPAAVKSSCDYERKVQALMLRHGYAYFVDHDGSIRLRELAIRGFTTERIVPHVFKSLQGAVDYLCQLCGADFSVDMVATFQEACL